MLRAGWSVQAGGTVCDANPPRQLRTSKRLSRVGTSTAVIFIRALQRVPTCDLRNSITGGTFAGST